MVQLSSYSFLLLVLFIIYHKLLLLPLATGYYENFKCKNQSKVLILLLLLQISYICIYIHNLHER